MYDLDHGPSSDADDSQGEDSADQQSNGYEDEKPSTGSVRPLSTARCYPRRSPPKISALSLNQQKRHRGIRAFVALNIWTHMFASAASLKIVLLCAAKKTMIGYARDFNKGVDQRADRMGHKRRDQCANSSREA